MTPWATRAKQAAVMLLGLVVAAIMVALGLWQLDVYGQQGARASAQRADAPPVAIGRVAVPGQAVGDGYGRTVTAAGHYDPKLQVLVPTQDGAALRVLTGLRLDGGGVLPVVRGQLATRTASGTGPTPPGGELQVHGVLLGSEQDPGTGQPVANGSMLPAVELPVLAQQWPVTLVSGFITVDADTSRSMGLQPSIVALPQGQGRGRNAAYALQWWIFAAFAIAFGLRMARDIARRDDYEYADQLGLGDEPGDDETGGDGDDPASDQPTVGLSRRA